MVATLKQERTNADVAPHIPRRAHSVKAYLGLLLDGTASNVSHRLILLNMVKRSRENSISSASDTSYPADESFLAGHPVSLKPADEKAHPLKYTELDGVGLQVPEVMRCSLPPHRDPISFSSYEEYEVHYAKAHTNRCLECRKNFPTEYVVGLHIAENHDPLNEARKARGEKIVSAPASMITMLLTTVFSTVALSKTVNENALRRRSGGCMSSTNICSLGYVYPLLLLGCS